MINQNKHFPAWRLAQDVVIALPRAAIPFFKIFWLPTLLNTIALLVARGVWFEFFDMRENSMPLWVVSVISAPFGAILTIAAFRYFDRGTLPKWREGFQFGRDFKIVTLLVLAFILVSQYAYADTWRTWVLLTWLGDARPTPYIYRVATLVIFASTIAAIVICTLVAIRTMAPIWTIVTKDQRDVSWLWHLFRVVPFSLFAFFLLFEVVYFQLGTLYLQLLQWAGIPIPVHTGATHWRAYIMLQLITDLKWLPYNYIAGLMWYTAMAKGLSTAWNMAGNDIGERIKTST